MTHEMPYPMLVCEADWMCRITTSRSSVRNMCCEKGQERREMDRKKKGERRPRVKRKRGWQLGGALKELKQYRAHEHAHLCV